MSSSNKDGLDPHLLKKFDIIKCVGKGAYGIVWKVQDKETGRPMALKRCFDAFHNSTDAQRTFREIMFLQELNGHENIVRLMNVMKADNNLDLFIVFDYMQSDLQHVISQGYLKPIHIEYVSYQVLKAMKYIHSAGVLHRDLKPSNVLMNANCHVRICDFGLARTGVNSRDGPKQEFSGQDKPLLTDYVATRWYRPPELLLGCTMYHEGVDMWGVGCIIGEMVGGKAILKGRSTLDQVEKIIELTGKPSESDLKSIITNSPCAKQMMESLGPPRQVPSTGVLFLLKAPPEGKNLVLSFLKFNPDRRMSAEAALEDPFVAKFHNQEPEPVCDRLIRMPILDTTKKKASEYRSQIYSLIEQRKKMAKDEEASGAPALSLSESKPLTGRHHGGEVSSRSKRTQESARCRDREPSGPWSHESGAAAPPTTPT